MSGIELENALLFLPRFPNCRQWITSMKVTDEEMLTGIFSRLFMQKSKVFLEGLFYAKGLWVI